MIEKITRKAAVKKYVACGAGSIKNNTRQTAADIAAEIQEPLPFGVEKDSPDPQVSSCTPTLAEDYRLLSAGAVVFARRRRTTIDTNLNTVCRGPGDA